jgi:hypothetical protein
MAHYRRVLVMNSATLRWSIGGACYFRQTHSKDRGYVRGERALLIRTATVSFSICGITRCSQFKNAWRESVRLKQNKNMLLYTQCDKE